MNKSLLALATGSFALGFAEFVMMGILPATATGLRVSVPDAGDFISAYALGVCAGTLFLVFGRRVPPKRLLLGFVALVAVGNAAAACAPSAEALVAARFVSGLPHGAFFGTATIVARELADPGREGQAVSIMVLGQTVANMVGVPGGTLLAALLSWRATFLFVAVWAVGSLLLIARFVPAVRPIPDAGLAGQFRFLKKPGPWLVIGAVLLGNTGVFCWWSYVSPWLTDIGGFPSDALPALLALAGFGMVFVSSPQQLLMVKVGRGGGEMIGSACVQVAFNLGNAFGATIGQAVLNAGASYASPSLAGVPFSLAAVALLAVFAARYERRYRAAGAPDGIDVHAARFSPRMRTRTQRVASEGSAMRQCMDADNLHRRLKKIVGQVQAIDRMVDEDVPCEDVLAQINAAKSALHKCGQVVLEGHIQHCVRDGIEHGDADKTIESFTKAVERFSNMS